MLRSVPANNRLHSNHSILPYNLAQHKCYFHNTNNITKFCINKKCTLPLCEKCIHIHVKQHSKEYKTLGKENIILYADAHKIAVQYLTSILQKKYQNIQIFQYTVKNIRKYILQIIDNEFATIEKMIYSKGNEVKILSYKHTKIKKGSLKALIFYFADEYGFKITSYTNKNAKSTMADEIIRLSEKLLNESRKFDTEGVSSRYPLNLTSNRKNYTSRPKYSEISSTQKHKYKSMKFESGTDFDKVLKDQKSRLENVRNKNLMFATNDGEASQNDNSKRYGSKSVDNFYSNKNLHENYEAKEETENRPLQFGFKTNSQSYSMRKQNIEECLNTQQTIDKIRRKYNGDQSLGKYKIEVTEQIKRYPLKTINTNDSKSLKFDARQRIFSDRIPDRETIRSTIENIIQYKFSKNDLMTKKYFNLGPDIKYYNHETFRRLQKLYESASKVKHYEFTLNKNYEFNEVQNKNIDKEKVLMSSIKKELKVVPMDEDRPKYGMFGHFFESKDSPRLSSFDARYGKRVYIKELNRYQQLNDFVINRSERPGYENLSKNYFMARKEKLYEDTKQRIKLSYPTYNKADFLEKYNQYQKQKTQTINNTIKTEKTGKEGRRFNYLYDTYNTIL